MTGFDIRCVEPSESIIILISYLDVYVSWWPVPYFTSLRAFSCYRGQISVSG